MNSDLLTVILASGSCAVLCLMILLLVVVLYQKDLLCCRLMPYRTQEYTNDLPHYNSRHSLIGIAHSGHSAALNPGAIGSQHPEALFIIGKPDDYQLTGPQPRLPSYESVRKKDRQRQIHSMIAQRFGLSGSPDEILSLTLKSRLPLIKITDLYVHYKWEHFKISSVSHTCSPTPPPTYEQTFYPTLQASSSNVQLSIHTCDESPHSGEEHGTAAGSSSPQTSPSFRILSP